MLLDSKTMIPQVYSKERDIQVFNKLIDIILTCCKYDIDNLGDLYDANRCPEQLLPLLAYTLNYNYDFTTTVTSNRRVIKAFTLMEKWRGSEKGLRMAAALSLTSLDVSVDNAELISDTDYLQALRDIEVRYDYQNAQIVVDYPNTYDLVSYLMDYVRPVGMKLEMRSVVGHSINTDAMLIYADVEKTVRQYEPDIDSHVSRSFVNLSGIADKTWLDQFEDSDNDIINLND
jgi:phage tail-like protein